MTAHARLKNEFTEHEKYHNLMRWLKYPFGRHGFRPSLAILIPNNAKSVLDKARYSLKTNNNKTTYYPWNHACASAQSRQNLRCSLIQAVSQEEPSDGKPDPWPLWMAGHAQLKFVMTECSKTQIRLTRPNWVHYASGLREYLVRKYVR